ncbi:hypothetical protein TL16_g00730 [Triparma laevis f. inornata]|uniref:Uncharacterized protein n=1 Tax=Triparma laevis f. inornata TaxID=1714386 RepID=A0A9W6ZHS5_9STRA|nr:hypothetical protein TL16_g00730 [Triparma laevis f. inornata]
MFTKPLDPLSGRNAKFTSSQDSILKIAYLKSTRRLPNNRGLVCMWSNFHKEVQRSEEFKGEEIKDSYLHEQRATVLGSQTSLINFEMLDELPFTKPLTRSWDPPNFFGSTPADDARNPFYKCSYKGKEVYNNDYGEEEEMGNKRLRLESSTATPPFLPPLAQSPLKLNPSLTPHGPPNPSPSKPTTPSSPQSTNPEPANPAAQSAG